MEVTITIKLNEEDLKMFESKKDDGKDGKSHSVYARTFDETCPYWNRDEEHNLMYLKHQWVYVNELLKARGHMLLNDVFDQLGLSRTKAGAVVGWVYNTENPVGDNYIDFGINNLTIDDLKKNGNSITLDFNVEGIVWDLMERA